MNVNCLFCAPVIINEQDEQGQFDTALLVISFGYDFSVVGYMSNFLYATA